jgi:DNA-binding transcriptional LysR family regulator
MPLDWDKLRVFHAAAEAGSFTHAGEALHLSQSAVSRQISALELEVGVPLFNRHARGLVLTEQGEMLFKTAHDVFMQLENVRSRLSEATDQPEGLLRVTTTVGLGTGWLNARVREFLDLHPQMRLQLIFSNEEIDLTMRHADCAIRLRQPQQPDLIQRRLFTVHFHLFASPDYIERHGALTSLEELDRHRIITFGEPVPPYLRDVNWLETAGLEGRPAREPVMRVNDIQSIRRAAEQGIGIAMLPDYMVDKKSELVRLLTDLDVPSFDTYFAYPETMRHSAKMVVFRDFLLAKAKVWSF